MSAGFFPILIACGVYGSLHSLLASQRAKDWAGKRLGPGGKRYYRLGFNLIGGITALLLFYLAWRLPDAALYQIPFPWILVTLVLQLVGGLGLLVGVGQTGTIAFLGLDVFFPRRKPRPPSPLQVLDTTLTGVQGARGTWKPRPTGLVTGGLYRWVRHPLYSCGLLILWLVPSMTWNLLALALGLSGYILVGIQFEERRLLREFGPVYKIYRRQTPMLIPFFKK